MTLIKRLLIITLLSVGVYAHAQQTDASPSANSTTPSTETTILATPSTSFTWGAQLGAAIDIGGHDMTNININAYFGLRNKLFHLLGMGAGVNMVMSNSVRFFPVYAIARTSFGYNSPFFAEMRLGVAFNDIDPGYHPVRAFIAPGVGFNLATGRRFRSYITLSYVYNDLKYSGDNQDIGLIRGLNYVNVAIGVAF